MQTLTQTLNASIVYETNEKALQKASALLELSRRAYKRHLENAYRAQQEEIILDNPKGWYQHPFITIGSQKRVAHYADISLMAAKRLMKAYKKVLFTMFCSTKL